MPKKKKPSPRYRSGMSEARKQQLTREMSAYTQRTRDLQEEADLYERSGRVIDSMRDSRSPRPESSAEQYRKADRVQAEVARRLPNSGTPASLRDEPGLSWDGGSLNRRGQRYSEFNDKGSGGGPTPGDRADGARRRRNAKRRSLKSITDKAVSSAKRSYKKGGSVRGVGCAKRGHGKGPKAYK